MDHTTIKTKLKLPIWLYGIVVFFLCVVILALAGELLVRVLVPKEFYQPISNIYRPVSDADVGYTFKPNFTGTAFGVPLRTNSLGFRGPEWPLKKKPNSVRIALIGDSHAFGYGVPFEETVGEKLAKLLTRQTKKTFEVLNFGVGGYNSRQELAVLHRYAMNFSPDIILVIPCSNDHEPALVADQQGFLYTATNMNITDKSIDQLRIQTSSWLIRHSRLAFYLMFLRKQYKLSHVVQHIQTRDAQGVATNGTCWMGEFSQGAIPTQLLTNVYAPLKAIIHLAKNRHIPIILANFNAVLDYRRLFSKLANEEFIPSVELLTLFPEVNSWDELQQQFGLGWNNHLNSASHERWAQALALTLRPLIENTSQ